MTAETQESSRSRLCEAISQLYVAFEDYPLRPTIDGCPCCVGEQLQMKLHFRSLHQLDADALSAFAFKSMTTWGDDRDFRHFLPRLLELLAFEPDFSVDPEILAEKLRYGEWRQWPRAEQIAVENYLQALWTHVISTFPHHLTAYSTVTALAVAAEDIKPYLKHWLQQDSTSALKQFCDFVDDVAPPLIKKRTLGNWWADRPEQVRQVLEWLSDSTTRQFVEDASREHSKTEFAGELSRAADYVASLNSLRS
jgi:hypothetical protein